MKTRPMMDKGIKILVVDDDNEITTTFQVGLRSHGFEVDIYNDPQLALSKFKPGFYDLILVDIRMPNMTGFEYCEKVRKKDDSVKICFVTAFEEYYKALSEIYKDLDCKCFIKKPILIVDLVDRIHKELR
jgi:two-component system, OmpR family, response regulator ChvI